MEPPTIPITIKPKDSVALDGDLQAALQSTLRASLFRAVQASSSSGLAIAVRFIVLSNNHFKVKSFSPYEKINRSCHLGSRSGLSFDLCASGECDLGGAK